VVVFVVLASLDNVVIGLLPPLYRPVAAEFRVTEAALGVVTAVTYLSTAVAAVAWAYVGDRRRRKPLLLVGTVLWVAGTTATANVDSFAAFVGAQLLTAAGLGAIGSVGFSVISDLVAPRRRGLVLAFWGLSQGVGVLCGTLVGGLAGAVDWRRPFVLLSVAGVGAAVAFAFTYEVRRGHSEPQLAPLFAAGGEYQHRMHRADLPVIVARRTNRYLITQGLISQAALGSLVWLPQLFQARALDQGYDLPTAIIIGSVFATVFQLGGALSIIGGVVGDRRQRRRPGGRAQVAGWALMAAVPLYLLLFALPFRVSVAPGSATAGVVRQVLFSLVTEPSIALCFVLAVLAAGLTSAASPNWYALVGDVNPPEHRATVFSLGNLANGVGRGTGTALVPLVFRAVSGFAPPPLNYALGLALGQLLFVPTGLLYLRAARTAPHDIAALDAMLTERAGVVERGGAVS